MTGQNPAGRPGFRRTRFRRRKLSHSLCLALILSLFRAAPAATLDLAPEPDPQLQAAVEALLAEHGWQPLVRSGDLSMALVVLGPDAPHLAMANGRRMVYAASLPKIAILLGAMVSLQEGDLELDDSLRADLGAMIRNSCNPCATRVLERVGRSRLAAILQRPEYAFYDRFGRGGLWVGKDYSGNPAFRRDPRFGISHGATAFQVARLYFLLQAGELLEPEYTSLMLDALSRPAIAHKFVAALKDEPAVEIWRKSGTWRSYHADSALVDFPGGRYILVGLVHSDRGEQLLRDLASAVHALVSSGLDDAP